MRTDSQMPTSRHAFQEKVVEILRQDHSHVEVDMTSLMHLNLNGKHYDLEDLYRMSLREPGDSVITVKYFLDRVLSIYGDDKDEAYIPLEEAQSRIMPRIKPRSMFDHVDKNKVAYIPFVNNTVIVFVMDYPQSTVSITQETMRLWGVTLEDLDEIARKNLTKYAPALMTRILGSKEYEEGRVATLAEEDGYDASRLLMPTLHTRLSPDLHGDFYVGIPARDIFLAFSFEPPGLVKLFRERIQKEYRTCPYPLTDQLFVVTRDGIAGTK